MNHSLIRWVGTILIVGIGIFFAFKMTNRWKVVEDKVYKLSLRGDSFTLADNKSIKVDISLVFKTEKEADLVSKKQDELNYDINNYIKEMQSSRFESQEEIDGVKYELLDKLKHKGYGIEYLVFESNPVVFSY